MADSKICNKCGEEKLFSDFYVAGKYRTLRSGSCKECVKTNMRALSKARPKKRVGQIKNESDLTKDAVLKCLEYLPDEGVFLRNGKPAGYVNDSGYIIIAMGGRDFRAHRMVWMMETGEFPPKDMVIDHINRNPLDNRFVNLRVIPQKINTYNIVKPKKQNSCGYLGVKMNKKRFAAAIHDPNGKPLHLGTFDTAELARDAYLSAKSQFYPEAVLI